MMRFYLLRYPDEWEFTAILWRLQIRIGNRQLAAWWHKGDYDFVTLFDTGRRGPKEAPVTTSEPPQ